MLDLTKPRKARAGQDQRIGAPSKNRTEAGQRQPGDAINKPSCIRNRSRRNGIGTMGWKMNDRSPQ